MEEPASAEIRRLLQSIEAKFIDQERRDRKEQTRALLSEELSVDIGEISRRAERILANRRARAQFFDADLLGEPAFDMLLDLFVNETDGVQVSVSSLCIASSVPTTTALRWVNAMVARDMLVRQDDTVDHRRSFVRLSDDTREKLVTYFRSTIP